MLSVKTEKRDEIVKSISKVSKDIGVHLESLIQGKHQFSFGNRIIQSQPIDVIRWMSEMIPDSSKTLHIRNIILNALNDSEVTQGASAVVCMTALSTILKHPEVIRNIKKYESDLYDDIHTISTHSRRASSNEILEILASIDRDPSSFKIAKATISECSANSTIQVLQETGKTSIKSVLGYKFPVICPDVFCNSSSISGDRKLMSPKVVVIDGFIESMSEIDGIVSQSFSTKIPLIIVARGFNNEVQNTLGTNFLHGHLVVIPIIVPYDELGANMINDVSVVCGANIVSSLKGDLISSRQWNDLVAIDEISVNFDTSSITISNESTHNSVKLQRQIIRKKKIELESPLAAELLNKRLMCLMGSGVITTIGSDLRDVSGLYTDRLNTHIRAYRSGSRFGTVGFYSIPHTQIKSNIMKIILDDIAKISDFYISSSLILGLKNSILCAKSIGQIGGIVYNDK